MALEFADIRDYWDVIKSGLMEIHEQVDPEWRPEDVYASCVNGDCHLMVDPNTDDYRVLRTSKYSDPISESL